MRFQFTGHSLGGGLASLMAVWFDRQAHVFAPAPFQASADQTQTNKDFLKHIAGSPAMKAVKEMLGDKIDEAFKNYDPDRDFGNRENNVKAWAVKGEVLEKLTYLGDIGTNGPSSGFGKVLAGIFFPNLPERVGLANVESIEGGRIPLFTEVGDAIGMVAKHSIDLHAAALIAPKFEEQMNKMPAVLELIFDEKLHGHAVTSNQQNFLVKLVRNEAGIRADDGSLLQAPKWHAGAICCRYGEIGWRCPATD